jgi:hypothetical protein
VNLHPRFAQRASEVERFASARPSTPPRGAGNLPRDGRIAEGYDSQARREDLRPSSAKTCSVETRALERPLGFVVEAELAGRRYGWHGWLGRGQSVRKHSTASDWIPGVLAYPLR